jgi:hypothetical protein
MRILNWAALKGDETAALQIYVFIARQGWREQSLCFLERELDLVLKQL